jgi:transposase
MRVRRWLNSSSSILSDRYHLILFYLLESEQNVRNYASRNIQNIQPGEKTKGDSLLYK